MCTLAPLNLIKKPTSWLLSSGSIRLALECHRMPMSTNTEQWDETVQCDYKKIPRDSYYFLMATKVFSQINCTESAPLLQ